MTDYAKIDYSDLSARDRFMSFDEIDTRQLAELHQLLEELQNGISVWEAMWKFERIMDIWAFGPFQNAVRHTDYQRDDTITKAQDLCRPFVKDMFLEGDNNQQTAKNQAISDVLHTIEENPDLTSFQVAEAMCKMVLHDASHFPEFSGLTENFDFHSFPDDPTFTKPWNIHTDDLTLLQSMLSYLSRNEKILRIYHKPSPIFGSLLPVPEADFVARLNPYIEKMREGWAFEGYQKLIQGIEATPSGSGQIKPHLYNPAFLPPHLQEKEPWSADDFSTYMQDDPEQATFKEEIYGTEIAIITTYSVRFTPCHPEQAEELATITRKALRVLGMIPPAFAIPFDYDSSPYKRPYFGTENLDDIPDERPQLNEPKDSDRKISTEDFLRYFNKYLEEVENRSDEEILNDHKKDKKPSESNCHVGVDNGRVLIHARLDLDDLYTLFYLLEHYMVLDAQIAQEINTARFLEARSAPQQKNGCTSSTDYSVDNVAPDKKIGHLEILPHGFKIESNTLFDILESSRKLYFGDQINEESLLEQVTVAATHSLYGTVVDTSGFFPTYDRLQLVDRREEKSGNVITFQQAIKERTLQFLTLITGHNPDSLSSEQIANALFQEKIRSKDGIRKEWQSAVAEKTREIFNSIRNHSQTTDFFSLMEQCDRDLKISDIVSGYAQRRKELEEHFGVQEGVMSEEELNAHYAWKEHLGEKASKGNPNIIERMAAQAQLDNIRANEQRQEQAQDEFIEKQKTMLKPRSGLVVRAPEVPPCADRIYPGTIYTSRLAGSAVPRHELPKSLRPFLDPRADPYQSVHKALLEWKDRPASPACLPENSPKPD